MALKIVKRPLPRWRVMIITFDLTDTVPGDLRYRDADEAMTTHGQFFKPIKQVRFLLTDHLSSRIKDSIFQMTGRMTLMIAPYTRAYQLVIKGEKKRQEYKRFIHAAQEKGLDTTHFVKFLYFICDIRRGFSLAVICLRFRTIFSGADPATDNLA